MIGRTYGVDLGTSVIKIYKKGKGIICNQKNMIAVDKNKVLAIGDDAFDMYEKVPGYVHVTYPIKNGVIADIENMEGATLFAIALAMELKVMQIRAISNRVGEEFSMWRINEALEALASVLKTIELSE